jgi:hypothetical protein
MNLNEIIANYRSMKSSLNGMGSWNFPLESVLHRMFGRYVPEDDDCGYSSFIGIERIDVRTMLKLFHNDSRTTEVHVLVIDEQPLGVVYQVGGGWRSYITDVEKYKAVCQEMAAARMDKELRSATPKSFETLTELGAAAISLCGPKESMFTIPKPRLIENFDELAQERKAYFVDEALVVHPVEGIFFFYANEPRARDFSPADNDVRVLIAGKERVVDGARLMFEVIPGHGDLEDALAGFCPVSANL